MKQKTLFSLKRYSTDFAHRDQLTCHEKNCTVKTVVYCLLWLRRSFVKSDKVTPMMSYWCRQGYLRLGMETKVYNTKVVLQTGGVGLKDMGLTKYTRTAFWEMEDPVSLELNRYQTLKSGYLGLCCADFDHAFFCLLKAPQRLWKCNNTASI